MKSKYFEAYIKACDDRAAHADECKECRIRFYTTEQIPVCQTYVKMSDDVTRNMDAWLLEDDPV